MGKGLSQQLLGPGFTKSPPAVVNHPVPSSALLSNHPKSPPSIAKRHAPLVVELVVQLSQIAFSRCQAPPFVEICLPCGPLRLASPRCGRREHTVDMGAVGGVSEMGEEMRDLLE
jgi:hypothetical protein